jgi:hypothetical protein
VPAVTIRLAAGSDAQHDATPRVWVEPRHGMPFRHVIDPGRYRCQRLACELADKWLEVAPELGRAVDAIAVAIRSFLRFTDTAWPEAAAGLTLAVLAREHLDGWEADQLARQRRDRADAPYRRVVDFFALLRRIGEDTPQALSPQAAARLRHGTRLEHIRKPASPEFDERERRLMLEAADRLVSAALASPDQGPGPAVLVALHIQLSLATGEPPEVLRELQATDVVPGDAASPGRSREVTVTYTKLRSAERYQVTYTRRERAALDGFTYAIGLTRPLRARTPAASLWLVAGPGHPARQASWFGPSYSLRTWVQTHVRDEDGNPAAISEPMVFRRFRKTVTAHEALADPAGYLRSRRRHSPRTFFGHYTASPVLRAEAGRILLDAIGEQFDAATSGSPLVITPDAEHLLESGGRAPGLSPLTAKKLTAGELDTPVAACRDPLDSPHAPHGSPCPVFANGQCYQCPYALITRRHLPAALALAERLHPDRAPDPALWARHLEPVYRFLTSVVFPAFSEADISAARQLAGQAFLDAGRRNDTGGVRAAP